MQELSPPLEIAKEAAAIAALPFVQSDMIVGLGTGSTASHFISHLGKKCRDGLKIAGVATSERSLAQAKKEEIPLVDIQTLSTIDIAIDGADEIDSHKRLIKGGGGAALREKIVASMSREFIVIADESKQVKNFGKFPLAVEILPFGYKGTISRLENQGYTGRLRTQKGVPYITDNGNYIFDIQLPNPCLFPERDDENIKKVVGVIETGFFIKMASQIIIGFSDNHVEFLNGRV